MTIKYKMKTTEINQYCNALSRELDQIDNVMQTERVKVNPLRYLELKSNYEGVRSARRIFLDMFEKEDKEV